MRYLYLIRAHQWIKNIFIFIPAFFAGAILQLDKVILLIQGFICFCLAASAIYILNDYCDRKNDRQHPVKKNRPIASGKISVKFAFTVMLSCAVLAIVWSLYLGEVFAFLVITYIVVNVSYSFGLRNVPLLDIFLVSSGFLIRTIAGGILVDVYISQWLIIMVFLLSLLLVFAKRRDDLVLAKLSGSTPRASSRQYSLDYINICLSLVSGVIMVSYITYTVSFDVKNRIGENYLYLTSLFVFGGLLRYLQVIMVRNGGGSPTRIFWTDRIIQMTVLGWMVAFFVTLYL